MEVGICLACLAALCIVGFPLRATLGRWKVPPAVVLMALGVGIGPSVLDWLPEAWLEHRSVLSKAAFVVLLLRAGVSLPQSTLKAIAVPALLLGTIPVAAEAVAIVGLTKTTVFPTWDLCILSAVLIAAVSPAVILPTMLAQKDLGRGDRRLIPDRIMGQTIVNAFIAQTGILLLIDVVMPVDGTDPMTRLAYLPLGLFGGVAVGIAAGMLLRIDPLVNRKTESAWAVRTAVLVALGGALIVYFGCGALGLETVFATLAVGVVLRRRLDRHEPVLRAELKNVWSVAEIVLFANLGSQINLTKLGEGTVFSLLGIMAAALLVRLVVAYALLRFSALKSQERLYSTVAQIPKATVQAVYGAYPLKLFIERGGEAGVIAAGETILIMAVLAIVATAPLGAVLLDRLGGRWLESRPSA